MLRRPSKQYGMKHDDTIVHGERLDRLEARNARLQEQAAIAEEHLQQLRSEVRTLRVAIQRLTRENPGSVMVVQLDVPGLRENIIRQAQERRIERSDHAQIKKDLRKKSMNLATKVQTGILRKRRLDTTPRVDARVPKHPGI